MLPHRTARLGTCLIACLCLMATALASADNSDPHPATKYPFSPPPSADLQYTVRAQQKGLMLKGTAHIRWTASPTTYAVAVETHTSLIGKLMESRSEGAIDGFGLAPRALTEKRFRKPPYTVSFDRAARTIRFSESAATYPIKGGEQDRTSIAWQVAAVARAAPDKLKADTQWTFFVAGRKNADAWTFRVVGRETVRTPLGDLATVHIAKLPSKSREQQTLDLWLAPSLGGYPARIVFKDSNGTDLDQVLQSISPR